MDKITIDTITSDHFKWKSQINEWEIELNKLQLLLNKLAKNNPVVEQNRKLKKYSNHILHNQRFLSGLSDTIKTHELFLEEFSEIGADVPIDDLGHKKNHEHIKLFEKKFNKLCKKVRKLTKTN